MRVISLFSGIGGLDLAAEWAGFEVVGFCEREPFCQKVLKKNWPNVPIFDDVIALDKEMLMEKEVISDGRTIDVISGGFPCQPFSIAGKREGKEDDRDLWPEMFRLIEEIRPRWVVGENVANFANMELDRTLSDLESIGYRGQSFIIPACAVNANHRRDRVFVVAYSDSKYVERGSIKKIQRQQTLQRELHARGFEDIRGVSEVYEPKLSRTYNGLPSQLDRIKALGNAVVPQQVYPIFEAIMKIESLNGPDQKEKLIKKYTDHFILKKEKMTVDEARKLYDILEKEPRHLENEEKMSSLRYLISKSESKQKREMEAETEVEQASADFDYYHDQLKEMGVKVVGCGVEYNGNIDYSHVTYYLDDELIYKWYSPTPVIQLAKEIKPVYEKLNRRLRDGLQE